MNPTGHPLSLKKKLIAFFSFLFLLFVSAGILGLYILDQIEYYEKRLQYPQSKIYLINQLTLAIHEVEHKLDEQILDGKNASASLEAQHKKNLDLFEQLKTLSREEMAFVRETFLEEQAELKTIEELEAVYLEFQPKTQDFLAGPSAGSINPYANFFEETLGRSYQKRIHQFLADELQEIEQTHLELASHLQFFRLLIVLSIGIAILLLVFLYSLIQKELAKPIEALTTAAKKVGAGDFCIRLDESSQNEIGFLSKTFNTMSRELEASHNAALKERQKLFSMLDKLPVCFHLQAKDHSVPFSNKMFRDRFGESQKNPCYSLVHGSDTLKIIESKTEQSSTWQAMDGRIYLVVCAPFTDVDGSELVMEMAVDITERENAKTELVKAKKTAEQANQAKSQFLARMSHEFRTPLNSILGFGQLLEMDDEPPKSEEQKENLSRILRAGEQLLELVDGILDLSALDAGEISLSPHTVNLSEIVDNAISLLRPRALEGEVTLQFDNYFEPPLFAHADASRLRQILTTLIANAVKFTRPGGKVCVGVEMREGDFIRVGVRDTGIGIPEDNRKQMFKAFSRISHFNDEITGAGINLAVAKQLIEMMGGRIDYESVVGEGSYFYFDIPQSTQGLSADSSQPDSGRQTEAKTKILYIENTPDSIELMKQIFAENPKIKLYTAGNVEEGIQAAQSLELDLILMDANLPGENGKTAFEQLQSVFKTRKVPIIALTAGSMQTDINQVAQSGFHSYITKPINIPELKELISKTLPKT
ncbi:MAG: response regulator [Candidatus Nitrohelix vancouverensis]|uniref:histidine kinase n=1 Tax=Candidatus Nitrohelix vancouverensis TaxID=2705534 RepID=A0A7T0C181_9BACT|nr:MAG: response regulator [Candidatus Nitrohelix vancouverensis]